MPHMRNMHMRILVAFLIICSGASVVVADTSASHAASTAPSHAAQDGHAEHAHPVPAIPWIAPFVILLLSIALLPLIHKTAHWWEHNHNKLMIAMILAAITTVYYCVRGYGFSHGGHPSEPGIPAAIAMLEAAVIADYVPFIVLLFSLYTISGGINLRGDIPAHPITNTLFLAIGAALASFIGTTGASMLLIRPLLQINSQRQHVRHTVIFFIFLVSNIGGCLLPIGDPPLFLGYLRGVPFLWTLSLWKEWLFCSIILLIVYFVWDTIAYRKEVPKDIAADKTTRVPLQMRGYVNFLWLLGVILCVGFMVPGKTLPGTGFTIPSHLREAMMFVLCGLSWLTTSKSIRQDNSFNFTAIAEVACLFIGIFICMSVPLEILKAKGGELGLTQPWHFFWASGTLSSFLDNAPTYAVYFETAGALHASGGELMHNVATASGMIPIGLLTAVSLGAVFMGANTYIGNGPNFMVKSIAEQSGVKMPSFFGYMAYSVGILIPLFILVTFVFLR